jgi:hypothetical protein
VDIKVAEEFLDELFSSLEALETRSTAVLQFLKEQGEVTDEELAPYFEQASRASNVRWRAARVRMMSLFSSAVKSIEESSDKRQASAKEKEEPSEPQMKPTAAEPAEEKTSQEESTGTQEKLKQPKVEAASQDRTASADSENAGPEERNAPEHAPRGSDKKDAA